MYYWKKMSENHIYPPFYYNSLQTCENRPPSEYTKSSVLRTTHNNKSAINHYLLVCRYVPVSLKTLPLRARHVKQRGKCGSLTSSKTQRGWSSKGQSLSQRSHLIGWDMFGLAAPRGLRFQWPDRQLKTLPLLPAPPLTSCHPAILPL